MRVAELLHQLDDAQRTTEMQKMEIRRLREQIALLVKQLNSGK